MKGLQGLAFLLLMQSAGEALSHFLHLPVPGPAVGMVLLLLALQWAPFSGPSRSIHPSRLHSNAAAMRL